MAQPSNALLELDRDLERINGKIAETKRLIQEHESRPIQLAIFGFRESGKTSLLISWYMFRCCKEEQLTMRFDEKATNYLEKAKDQFKISGSTEPTSSTEPKSVSITIKWGEEKWTIVTQDFPGEALVARGEDDPKTARGIDEIRKAIRKSDAIVCLHPVDDKTEKTLNAIDVVLGEASIPFKLALTKFDRSRIEATKNQIDRKALLKQLRSENKAIDDLCATLSLTFDEVGDNRILPLSAFGQECSENVAIEDLRPLNIYAPLRFAIDVHKRRTLELQHLLQSHQSTQAETKRLRDERRESEAREQDQVRERTKQAKHQAEKQKEMDLLAALAAIESKMQEFLDVDPTITNRELAQLCRQARQLRSEAISLGLQNVVTEADQVDNRYREWRVNRLIDKMNDIEIRFDYEFEKRTFIERIFDSRLPTLIAEARSLENCEFYSVVRAAAETSVAYAKMKKLWDSVLLYLLTSALVAGAIFALWKQFP